ncbi:MAG: peptidoglycan bridge formation glycyltransferase FemA/FemB family protein [Bacteroidetes bacterium]|nr:MAG: peptidoglycan bridge formation glycyltransferase FemA/FemB family protein [Bacteroidota bacterium]
MQLVILKNHKQLVNSVLEDTFRKFVLNHPEGNFFQSIDFFKLCKELEGFEAFLLLSVNNQGEITGSMMGVIQTNGTGLKSWFSRRVIIWGGPLVLERNKSHTTRELLKSLKEFAAGKAIFIEFRNLFDCEVLKQDFEWEGFQFQPYLNFLIETDDETRVLKRMHGNRRREINKSLKTGAQIREANSIEEVHVFYNILDTLYREKVKKPLPEFGLFQKLWESESAKIFVVLFDNKIIGGAACPVFDGKVIYDWFHCGVMNVAKGVFAGVLAAWAPIKYALDNDFEHMDFMGGGKPDETYGVRDFKARYGGEMVSFGRFVTVLNRPLFEIGKLGLKVYQKLKINL